jgi:predicted dienelactone hydrolase
LSRAGLHAFALLLVAFVMGAGLAHAQYPVGTANVTYIDGSRGNRAVPVDLYYPATAAGAGQPVALPSAGGGFPAVAVGHGFQIPASAYSWVAGRLVSIGCVVAVPRTGAELFPSHEQFGLDLAFAARALRDAGADPASPFFGRMGSRTLVVGHSMGGGCSLLAAAGDPSLTAVAAFAAAETNPSAIAACAMIDRPALLFAGANDCVTPPAGNQVPMFESLAGWRALVTIDGASHCQFNAYSLLCDIGESCSAAITRQQQQDTVWLLLEPWVRWVLLQEAGAGTLFEARAATREGFAYAREGAVAAVDGAVPRSVGRLSAAPNPFNPTVVVSVELDRAGPAQLAIYDLRGRRVRVLVDGALEAGVHSWRWDGRDEAGSALAAGAYIVELAAGGARDSRRVLMLK